MNCDKNLLKKPRDEELFPLVDYMISPPRADEKNVVSFHEVRETISAKRAKREAFMLCGMISAVNEAIRYYKLQACGKDGLPAANWNETYTVHEDPSDH